MKTKSGVLDAATAEEVAKATGPRSWGYTDARERAALVKRAEMYLVAVDAVLSEGGFLVAKREIERGDS